MQALSFAPRTVLEPTCGRGAFLAAARGAWPSARLIGRELDPDYAAAAREVDGAEVEVADAFDTDWGALCAGLEEPILVLGNPPWVTSATLGVLGSARPRARIEGIVGLDAITGQSNFDVSELIVSRLLDALDGRDFVLAMLLKTAVARRIAQRHAVGGDLRAIDARRWFDAAVDAALVVASPGPRRWRRFDALDAAEPVATWGVVDGVLTTDLDAFERTRSLAGTCVPAWRSGVKHDCAAVMELTREGGGWRSRAGVIDIEPDRVYPLLKGGDLARDAAPTRAVIATQTRLGEPTDWMRVALPRTWAYLDAHRPAFDRRKSRIYRGQPPFAMFGVGDYAFAPWKVAVAGLYPDLAFRLVGPHDGKPVLLDDTCYFLPFATQADAERSQRSLSSYEARVFFAARAFPDAKRPITKRLLMSLDLARLAGC